MTENTQISAYGAYSGQGREDLAIVPPRIPYILLLQDLSPQCKESNPKHVPGAKPGLFLNAQTGELFSQTSLVFAAVVASVNEWKPRKEGGGLVAKHDLNSPIVAEAKARAQKTKTPWKRYTASGNDLVETYTVYAVLTDNGQPTGVGVLSFKSTAIPPFQAAMGRISGFRGGKDVPIFAHEMILTSINDKNKSGQEFSNFRFAPAKGDPVKSLLPGNSPVLEVAAKLRESVLSGASTADMDNEGAAEVAAANETTDVVF